MGKVKFTLTNLIFWVLIVVSSCFFSNLPLFGEVGNNNGFTMTTFGLFTFIESLLLFLYFFLEHKKNKLKIDFVLLPICIMFFIWNVIIIWTNKTVYSFSNEEYHKTFEAVITVQDKWISTVESGLSISLFYALMFVFGRTRFRAKQSLALPLFVILVVVVFSFISVGTDFETYRCMFTGEKPEAGVMSVFHNENSLAVWYLYGILCCLILNHYRPRWWGYFLMFYLFIAMIFTTCLSTLIISSTAILIFTFYEIIAGFRKKWKKSLVLLVIFVFILGSLTGLYFIGEHFEWKIVLNAKKFADECLFNKDVSTLSHRVELWKDVFKLAKMDTARLIFGYGNLIDTRIFIAYLSGKVGYPTTLRSTHSGYVSILLRYGIAGLVLYASLIGYCIYSLIHDIVRKKVRFALVYALCIACVFAHQFVESFDVLTANASGLLMLGLFFMPPIWANRHGKYEKKHRDILDNSVVETKFTPQMMTNILNVIFVSLILVSAFLLTVPNVLNGELGFIVPSITLLFTICLLFYPYLITVFYQNSKTDRFAWRTFLNVLWALAVPSALFTVLKLFSGLSILVIAIVSIILFVLTLFIQLVIYTFARKGSFKMWGSIVASGLKQFIDKPILVSIMISGIVFALLTKFIPFDQLNIVLEILITVIIYMIIYFVYPKKEEDNVIKQIGKFILWDYKRILEKEKD